MIEVTFDRSKNTYIRFGKYNGRTIEEIATTNDGLRYLDWLVGQEWIKGYTRECLGCYLADPAIKRDLETIINE